MKPDKSSANRRAFLKSAGLGLTGLGLHGATGQDLQAGVDRKLPDIDDRRGVELAIATICLDGFGDEDFGPAFELIPQVGVRNVEFNVWYPRNVTLDGIKRIRQRCFEAGLTPICLQGTAFGGSAVKDVAHKLWLMEQTQQLGCRRVKFTGARRGEAGGLETVIEVLRELAPAAEDLDVLLLVENHANNNIENVDDYERIFDAIPSAHVGMCLDMGHFDGAGISNFDVIDRFHERIYHIDLKDTIAFGTYKTVNYGEGATDVAGIVERMLSHDFTGYLVIEQAPPLNPDGLLVDMQRARSLFEKYEK